MRNHRGGGDIEKTDIDIEYLKSIKELIQDTNFDIIIVANLKFKNQSKIFEDLRIKYIDDIIYEIKNQDNYLEYYKLIAILYRLKMENIYGVSDYLIENNYKNIAIWGVNELSLLLGDELSKCDDIKSVCIYDNTVQEDNLKINVLNYDVDIRWIESIDTIIIDKNMDVVIISDINDRSKYLINLKDKKILYIDELLYGISNKENNKRIEKSLSILNQSGVKAICVSIPSLKSINNLKVSTLKRIKSLKGNFDNLSENDIQMLFDELGGKKYLLEFFDSLNKSHIILKENDIRSFSNFKDKYISFVNGERVTLSQPNEYKNSIYLIGSCIVASSYADDNHTLSKYLQDLIINHNLKYRVVAYGGGCSIKWKYYLNRLKKINFVFGDIIIFIDSEYYFDNPDLNIKMAFNKLYKREEFFFDDPIHCTYKGYKVVAEEIFKYLIKSNFLTAQKSNSNKLYLENNKEVQKYQKKVFEGNRDLLNYVDKLKTLRIEENKVIGSIVMNCNPFTLGHRYLIEQSLKNVDWLYIFVVEEDKSMFSFEDRFRLIQENTKDLNNITIVPSGNFIISSKTFSAYFSKDTPTETKIDTSTDIEVFAQHIVPALNINIRFVGEEPFDIVTNQYNRSMKDILPKYGVEVRVIPRKKFGEEVISASTVRKLLKQKDFNKIKNFVPSATYDFLLKLMSSKNQI